MAGVASRRSAVAWWVAIVVGVIVSFPVAAVAAYPATALVTGWRHNPDLIQGCDSELLCAETTTYVAIWGLFVVVAVVALVLVLELAFRRFSK